MTNSLNILQHSPLDRPGACDPVAEPPRESEVTRWVPSRYNLRTTTEDGRLILWNSFHGAMSVFPAEQRERIGQLLKKKGFEAEEEGAVEYLVKRRFLVPEGTDEYRQFQMAFGARHYRNDVLELILLATEDCNFRCQYCYESFAHGTMRPEVRSRIKKLVEARIEHLRRLEIGWFGGEPLYGWEAVKDLAPFFHEVAQEHALTYTSNMTTNGYLLTPDVAEQLLSWRVSHYQITVDGLPEDHDRSRPTREGGPSFWQIFNNLKALRERPEDFKVDIRVNFSLSNVPRLGEFLDLVEKSFGGDSRFQLRFRPVGRWGGENDDELEVTGIEEGVRLRRELELESGRRGLFLADPFRKECRFGKQVCYAARPSNLVIGARGQVMKCTVALDEPFNQVGELQDDGTLQLDAERMARWTEPAFERDSQCKRCVVLPVCQGISCPLQRVQSKQRPCIPARTHWRHDLLKEAFLSKGGRETFVQEA